MDKLRGHEIKLVNGKWIYCDSGELTSETWMDRPCGHCCLHNTPEGHDGCLGALPNVINACCGHGEVNEAYVQFTDKAILRNSEALQWIKSHSNSKTKGE